MTYGLIQIVTYSLIRFGSLTIQRLAITMICNVIIVRFDYKVHHKVQFVNAMVIISINNLY